MTFEQWRSDHFNHIILSSSKIFNGSTVRVSIISVVGAFCLEGDEERKTELHEHTEICIHIYINLPWFQEPPVESH